MKPRPWDRTHPENIFGISPEKRFRQLEERVSLLERALDDRFPGALEVLTASKREEARERRGPKPRISDEQLQINRHRLIDLLENYWPEIQPVFKRADPTCVRTMLLKFTEPRFGHFVSVAVDLLTQLDFLISFLQSAEYSGDPRQIANAMAGVPKISWSTSLKRCRAMPCTDAVKERALRDYLRRNFHSVYIRIRHLSDTDAIRTTMALAKTDDREYRWLAENPEFVLQIMQRGLPQEF